MFQRALKVTVAVAVAGNECNVPTDQRKDCGYSGTKQSDCEASGCCWVPAGEGSSIPWCFFKAGPSPSPPTPTPPPTPPQCNVTKFDKVDCSIGSSDQCLAAGCCWQPIDPNPGNLPWCYHQQGTVKSCTLNSPPKTPFTDEERSTIFQYFEKNLDIQGSGMVVAAPDHNTGPGGDYYYAWQRDGALSMGAYLEVSPKLSDVETKMDHWVSWVQRSYNQVDPFGDIMTEPKFNIPDGTVFSGGWCRPQNDGPGLRAITLMAYAKVKPSVAQVAWGMIKQELDWVVANYTSTGCDLWEEVTSNDFFWNRYTMRRALFEGSKFAISVGQDAQRSQAYESTAQTITNSISNHIDSDNYVFESENRKIDTAVIEAFNVGDMADGVFAPLSKEVATTLNRLSHVFCNAYTINQDAARKGLQGVLYGRYQGDTYDGGNPWVLLTASAATLLYRQSVALASGAPLDADAESMLKSLLYQPVTSQSLLGGGDAILNRMKTFLTNGVHMNEQIDRNTGEFTSAKDLTWNYANVLKAMKVRDAAVAAIAASLVV